MKTVMREEYLDWLIRWKDQQIIKVVSGVRRCGKSTLFEIYRDKLLEMGVKEGQIIYINFENIEFEHLTDYKALHSYVLEKSSKDHMNYVFLDEIQHVDNFERAVDSLFIKKHMDVYITGSNAYFMSGELATLLSGRYVELKMLPLSFKEFCEGTSDRYTGFNISQLFDAYIRNGSFPFNIRFRPNENEAREYLRDIYNSILLKDVVARLNVSEVEVLENVTKFVLHNIGSTLSPTKIANTLKSQGRGVDQKTVEKYIRGLCDSLMLYQAVRYNIKGKLFLSTQHKYYAVDVGLRTMLVGGSDSDIGHILENVVYLELLRRGYKVYVGQTDNEEVDFVAIGNDRTAYYQVSASALSDETLKRELRPLKKIQDNYPKYLLTLDEVFANTDYEGIIKLNAIDWLLGK